MKTAALLLLLALPAAAYAAAPPDKGPACPFLNQPIAITRDSVGQFSATGKYLKDIPRSAVPAGATVLDCNEELGLVKLKVAGEAVWLDRLAVSIRPADSKLCMTSTVTRPNERTELVSSGIGANCTPEKPKP